MMRDEIQSGTRTMLEHETTMGRVRLGLIAHVHGAEGLVSQSGTGFPLYVPKKGASKPHRELSNELRDGE